MNGEQNGKKQRSILAKVLQNAHQLYLQGSPGVLVLTRVVITGGKRAGFPITW